MHASGRSNAVDLYFASNGEHLKIMPIVSADCERWPPVVLMPGVMQNYRVRSDGWKEFLVACLPKGTFIMPRTPASMNKDYFINGL